MSFNVCASIARFSGALVVVLAGAAQGAMIVPGTYELSNHPDGSSNPPPYGLRLDELYNETSGHDIFTFDFDHPSSSVFMDVTATTIHIYGSARGGRDIGAAHAMDSYLGMYTFDFVFSTGVQSVPGDDDVWVDTANYANTGTIMTPLGDTIDMHDYRGSNPFSFRLGDEDNDAGHRGFAGISGWGWINHGPDKTVHFPASDWLFTATLVPTPGAGAMALVGGAMMMRRRRER